MIGTPLSFADAPVPVKLDLSPMTGEEVQALVAEAGRTPPDIVARVKFALDAPAK